MRGISIRSQELANGWEAIAVEGEIDLATVEDLQAAIDAAFTGDTDHLIVDLNGATFMDSTGLKALVMANRRFAEAGRSFAIAVSGGPVSRLIDLSGVDSAIRTVATVEDLD